MMKDRGHLLSGIGILLIFLVVTVLGPQVAPHSLADTDRPFLTLSRNHLLGTNDMGVDLLSELIHAGRVSLAIGTLAAAISVTVGVIIGILAGYFRGVAGQLFTSVIDICLLIPMLPLMVVLAAYLGQGWWNIVLAISLVGWCATARAVRAKVLQLREARFVEALKGVGIPTRRILSDHMLPHVMEIVAAKFILAVAGAMLSEAALAFIGLGDPAHSSWGMMVHYAFKRGGFAGGMWWWYLPPGICIGLCTLGFILMGMHFESIKRRPVDL
jgi:peptide/nickel transport system permease protein